MKDMSEIKIYFNIEKHKGYYSAEPTCKPTEFETRAECEAEIKKRGLNAGYSGKRISEYKK